MLMLAEILSYIRAFAFTRALNVHAIFPENDRHIFFSFYWLYA